CLDCFSIKKVFLSGPGSKIRFMRRAPIPDMERSPSRPFVNTWTRKNGRKRKARSPRSRKSSKRWLAASTKRRKISRMRSPREQSEDAKNSTFHRRRADRFGLAGRRGSAGAAAAATRTGGHSHRQGVGRRRGGAARRPHWHRQ